MLSLSPALNNALIFSKPGSLSGSRAQTGSLPDLQPKGSIKVLFQGSKKQLNNASDTRFDDAALTLLQKRYLPPNTSVDAWLTKLVKFYTQNYEEDANATQQAYRNLIAEKKFFPTSAALINPLSGEGGLSGCMVLPTPKNTKDLFETAFLQQAFTALQKGIGVGLDLSEIAPEFWTTPTDARSTPGPNNLIKAIVSVFEPTIKHTGVKHSAFMGSLSAEHPDIFKFIQLKSELKLPNINVSVALSPNFIKGLKEGSLIPAQFGYGKSATTLTPRNLEQMQKAAYNRGLPSPDHQPDLYLDGAIVKSHAAKRPVGKVIHNEIYLNPNTILDVIAERAHDCGDPGLLNMAAINKANPLGKYTDTTDVNGDAKGAMRAVTPCGEQPLFPYEVCHLGSIALPAYVDSANKTFDFEALKRDIPTIVQLMDDIVEVGDNGIAQANRAAKANRKIGIMGVADVFAALELPYNSPQAISQLKEIQTCIQTSTHKASQELATGRGSFLNWSHSAYKAKSAPHRNATLTTIAPTGHISTLAGVYPSIEPYFAIRCQSVAGGEHTVAIPLLDQKLKEINYSLSEWMKASGKEPNDGLQSLKELSDTPTGDTSKNERLQALKRIFITAHDLTPNDHLKVLETLQPLVDNGISKTINLPNSATVHDVKTLMLKSIEQGLKGITVYRDGCQENQALKVEGMCTLTDGSCG